MLGLESNEDATVLQPHQSTAKIVLIELNTICTQPLGR
jgi:hypothetical protein